MNLPAPTSPFRSTLIGSTIWLNLAALLTE
jgi:hypothetical protein